MYIVIGNCGDFYCGCGGGHVLGVAGVAEIAEKLEKEAEAEKSYGRLKWSYIKIVEVPANTLLDGEL